MANEIIVRTEKGEYVGGDTIYGCVYVRVTEQQLASTSLKLVIRGYEISEYDYTYIEEQEEGEAIIPKTRKRTARKDVVKFESKLVDYPGGFPVGYYAYAFMQQLPIGIPGVFTLNHVDAGGKSWEGIIRYTLSAQIEAVASEWRLGAEVPIVVYDNINCKSPAVVPDEQMAMGSVRTFFCISRGSVQVTLGLKRSAYDITDRIPVTVMIRNESSSEVSGCTVKLIRIIKLLGTDRTKQEEQLTANTLFDTIAEMVQDGCPRGTTVRRDVDLDLNRFAVGIGIPPSCSGSIVKCSYVLDVEVHIPWAPDVEVRHTLTIRPPTNTAWSDWRPPSWITNCKPTPAIGPCAVPPDITSSHTFSGMPGFQPLL